MNYAPGTVRLMLSRSVKDGDFLRVKAGKSVYYSPNIHMAQNINQIGAWAFIKGYESVWDSRWYIVTYQIPDERRELRERLRTRFTKLGFGRLNNSLWLAPFDQESAVIGIAEEFDVSDLIVTLRGDFSNLSPSEIAARAWRLPDIAGRYQELINTFTEIENAIPSQPSDEQAFAAIWESCLHFVMTAHDDPRLPAQLLPQDWPGQKAADHYKRLESQWLPQALRFFETEAVFY